MSFFVRSSLTVDGDERTASGFFQEMSAETGYCLVPAGQLHSMALSLLLLVSTADAGGAASLPKEKPGNCFPGFSWVCSLNFRRPIVV
jgi:hypothetical protein